jgi:hypothetical protein
MGYALMDADWSVELGAEDAVLEFPWASPDGLQAYVDLRNDPGAIAKIPEAVSDPELGDALVLLNRNDSPWLTAKCDVWQENIFGNGLVYDECFKGSYIDLVARDSEARFSFERHEAWVKAAARALSSDDSTGLSCELVVRRCWYHEGDNLALDSAPGFSVTFYLVGSDCFPDVACNKWARGLRQATTALASFGL